MGQIGSNIATGMANKLLPGSVPADQYATAPVSANQRQAAAGQMNRSLLEPLAKQMQQRWAQVVQQLVSTSSSACDIVFTHSFVYPSGPGDLFAFKQLFHT